MSWLLARLAFTVANADCAGPVIRVHWTHWVLLHSDKSLAALAGSSPWMALLNWCVAEVKQTRFHGCLSWSPETTAYFVMKCLILSGRSFAAVRIWVCRFSMQVPAFRHIDVLQEYRLGSPNAELKISLQCCLQNRHAMSSRILRTDSRRSRRSHRRFGC